MRINAKMLGRAIAPSRLLRGQTHGDNNQRPASASADRLVRVTASYRGLDLAVLLRGLSAGRPPSSTGAGGTTVDSTTSKADGARQQRRDALDKELARIRDSLFPEPAHDAAVAIANDPQQLALLTPDERLMLVKALFRGNTNESEEDAALRLLVDGTSPEQLRKMVDDLGWEKLDDELDGGDLDRIAARLASAPREGEQLAAKLVADQLGLDWEPLDLKALSKALAALPPQAARDLAARLLQGREDLRATIEQGHDLGKPARTGQILALLEGLASRLGPIDGPTATKLRGLRQELHCTDRVAGALARGDFEALLQEVGKLSSTSERATLLDLFNRYEDRIRAMVDLVGLFGSAVEQTEANRFLRALEVGRGAAEAGKSPEEILAAILYQGLGQHVEGLSNNLDELTKQFAQSVSELGDKLNLGALLDFNGVSDDKARAVIKQLHAKGLLNALPLDKKAELARAILDTSWTDGVLDDDEQALLLLLGETKKQDPAQFYQLLATIGWSELDDHLDGAEHDELLRLCNPSHAPL